MTSHGPVHPIPTPSNLQLLHMSDNSDGHLHNNQCQETIELQPIRSLSSQIDIGNQVLDGTKQNILTLKGNFASFAIETVTSILIMVLIQDTRIATGPSLIVPLVFIHSALMTISFFILSPEL